MTSSLCSIFTPYVIFGSFSSDFYNGLNSCGGGLRFVLVNYWIFSLPVTDENILVRSIFAEVTIHFREVATNILFTDYTDLSYFVYKLF